MFCIGGMGVTNATAVVRGADGLLKEQGQFVFDSSLDGLCQVDANTMVGLELPATKQSGQQLTFYTVDAYSAAILNKNTSVSVDSISTLD